MRQWSTSLPGDVVVVTAAVMSSAQFLQDFDMMEYDGIVPIVERSSRVSDQLERRQGQMITDQDRRSVLKLIGTYDFRNQKGPRYSSLS